MQVVLLGPPGAGKGTQAKLICEHLGVAHVSTGDLLRAAVAAETELGTVAKRFMDRGELVPDDLVIAMLEERLQEQDCRDGFVLDGFPRTRAQALALEQTLSRRNVRLDRVLSLTVPRDELIGRLSGRRTCGACGAMYHVRFAPPRRAGICDRCEGRLVQREDDREETVRARFDVYEREAAPLREHYRERGQLREIDGLGSAEEVFRRVLPELDGRR